MLLENNPYPQDVRVRNEAESLANAGYSITVVAPRAAGQPRLETVRGIRVRRFRGVAGGTIGAQLAEYALANLSLHCSGIRAIATGADVLHLHNPPDTLFAVAALARFAGRRVVFDHHDLFPELVDATGRGPLWQRLALACERLTFRSAHLVLATNDSYRDVALGRGGKAQQEVVVVRNGPRSGAIAREVTVRRGSLDDPLLVYVGALGVQDGVNALPEILQRMREEHGVMKPRLLVIGDGVGRGALEAEVAERGLGQSVHVTGWVDHEQVGAYLRAADICIDPAPATDLNNRSTMVKIAEYLAAAKPVVAYDLVETRRTVGGAGFLVAPGSPSAFAASVARLAGDGDLRERASVLAVERASSLVWEHSATALEAAYGRLVHAHGAGCSKADDHELVDHPGPGSLTDA